MLSGTGFPPVIPARGTGDGQPPGPESHVMGPLGEAAAALDPAVSGLRRAGAQHHIPSGLLTRAWLRCLTGVRTGPDSAQSDLDEAWEIAERGPMPLFLADIHLHRARLFGPSVSRRALAYPWISAKHDLAEARKRIEKCGYGCRIPELEDAERALLGQTP